MSNFSENDMVFTKIDKKIFSGGYEIDSPFLNNNIPVSYSLNESSMFGGLVVPSGLLFLTPQSKLTTEFDSVMSGGGEPELINDNLYDKLFTLAQLGGKNVCQNKQIKTKRVKKDTIKKTRKTII